MSAILTIIFWIFVAALADQLDAWAAASMARAELMRVGPLFGAKE